MPQNGDSSKQKSAPGAWLLACGLATLLLANLALVAVLAVGAWREYASPPLVIGASGAPDLRVWFETYRDRVDSLSRLVTALIGLSALYSTAIGVTAYLSVQFYVDRFKETITDARDRSRAQLAEFEAHFPSFADMNAAVERVVRLLASLVPDVERLEDHEGQLTPASVQLVLHYEKSVAFFEFLKQDGGADAREVYRRLGRFYRALYEIERRRLKQSTVRLEPRRKPLSACRTEELAAYRLLDRAEFYIDHLLDKDPDNFAAWNEKAILTQIIDGCEDSPQALRSFQRSLRSNGRQQRALYWLGCALLNSSDPKALEEAERSFSRALQIDVWEHEKSSPERTTDLQYNRACARSRLAELNQAAGPASRELASEWACKALADLSDCSAQTDLSLLANLQADIRPNEDLGWLAEEYKADVDAIRKRLGDRTVA
jgi:hypothetical protein